MKTVQLLVVGIGRDTTYNTFPAHLTSYRGLRPHRGSRRSPLFYRLPQRSREVHSTGAKVLYRRGLYCSFHPFVVDSVLRVFIRNNSRLLYVVLPKPRSELCYFLIVCGFIGNLFMNTFVTSLDRIILFYYVWLHWE